MAKLSDEIDEQIQSLCQEGDELAGDGTYAKALDCYWAAWNLLPEPKTGWEAATWILGAVGDANYLNRDFAAGRDNLSFAMRCPGAIGNAFLHLRLGQCDYQLGNLDRAADELTRAYMAAGVEIFEQDDTKYLAFLKTRLEIAPRFPI